MLQKLVLGFVLICIALIGLGNGQLQSNTVDVTSFGAVGDGKTDDSKAFLKAWAKVCGKKGSQTLQISHDKTFKLQPLVFQGPCKSTTISFQLLGNISAPNKSEWAKDKKEKWIIFNGVKNLIVDGSGVIQGSGSTWWKGKDSRRPTSLTFKSCNNLQLKSITSINSARNHISISSCIGVTISYVTLIAPKDSPNTDGINVSGSSQMNLFDSIIGTGDDCVAINGGCSGINITNVKCGPGHGLSVGSLGKRKTDEDIVEHVYVKNCTFNGTQNGARIKTVPGGTGYAKNILFEDITLINTENPIVIDQHYGCKNDCPLTTSAVEVSNVKFIGFHGSVVKEAAIQLNCSEVKRCNDIVLENISIVPAEEGETLEVVCNNVGGTVQNTIPLVSCLSKP
ncbi:putative polygalacturonase [Cardamine amara subsp. amara]|uniref:Polygalacturonase n=1 Tax=Cardamine amara subsp. amara TaxID=228776 RepID=A0ABD1C9J6_CARAN